MVRTLGHNLAQAGFFFFLYFHSSLYYAAETRVSLYLSLHKTKNEKMCSGSRIDYGVIF